MNLAVTCKVFTKYGWNQMGKKQDGVIQTLEYKQELLIIKAV